MKISFLILHVYGLGGTIRTTITLANQLADRGHEVEIISLKRHKDKPHFTIDPRVKMTSVVDYRKSRRKANPLRAYLRKQESRIIPQAEKIYEDCDRYHDYRLRRVLRGLDSDVIIGTRPGLNLAIARLAPANLIRIGQEHVFTGCHEGSIRKQMAKHYPEFNSFVTLTAEDRKFYENLVPGLPVHTIPNALPNGTRPDQSPLTEPVILAIGRLAPVKRYSRLIRAFSKVLAERPDWRLRFVGAGPKRAELENLVEELGIGANVEFAGQVKDVYGELARASIHAISSQSEGFPMTILESFACGVPVVSVDCPNGPRNMITDGQDGLLVKRNEEHLAAGLLRLIDDPELRYRMGDRAVRTAAEYNIDTIADRWEELFTGLVPRQARRVPAGVLRMAGR